MIGCLYLPWPLSITVPIIEAVYLQYARLLKSADILDGALYYCKKAGEQGTQLLAEIEGISSAESS